MQCCPEPEIAVAVPVAGARAGARSDAVGHAVLLVLMYAAPALVCLHAASMADPDVWWHLRAAEWMVQHRAAPHGNPFSSVGAGRKGWMDYSWLFELALWKLFNAWGLAGILAYTTAMIVGITAALYRMVRHIQLRRRQPDVTQAVLLTAAGAMCLGRLYTPRPWLCTILLFVVEVDLLLEARATGRWRLLLWLPPLFALWANLHIQFVDGLAVLGLAALEPLLTPLLTGPAGRASQAAKLRGGWLWGVLGASVLAALANPYGWRIYQAAYELVSQGGVLDKVGELQAIPFREPGDYLLLLLVLLAAGMLGWKRRLPVFETGLLAFGAVVSFRSQRDVWVVATAAIAILAEGLPGSGPGLPEGEGARRKLSAWGDASIAAAVGAVLLLGAAAMQVNNARLRARLAERMPVRAVELVKQRGYGGPLFNNYSWGGFLMWELRLPVSIDGRAALYGDGRIDRSVETWSGAANWASDPGLAAARLVIAPASAPLTQLLRLSDRFQLVYEDRVAVVFVARAARAGGKS